MKTKNWGELDLNKITGVWTSLEPGRDFIDWIQDEGKELMKIMEAIPPERRPLLHMEIQVLGTREEEGAHHEP